MIVRENILRKARGDDTPYEHGPLDKHDHLAKKLKILRSSIVTLIFTLPRKDCRLAMRRGGSPRQE